MPHPSARHAASAAAVVALLPALAGAQIAVGQRDTFQDGTTQGWIIGAGPGGGGGANPVPPLNVPTGGPAGAGDRYLQLTALGGNGPGSRLGALNFGGQWAGDYRAAGVNAVTMDVKNLGTSDLFLRLVFEDPTFTSPPQNFGVSSSAVFLRAGGDWQRVVFPLFGPGGLAPLFASDLNVLMGRVTVMRLVHSELFEYPPAAVQGRLGVDNITAAVIPEPTTVVLVGAGALLLGAAGVVRRRSGSA